MNQHSVKKQLREIYSRLIRGSISIQQFEPATHSLPNGKVTVGNIPSSVIALKNIAYSLIYEELNSNNSYHIKLPDGGLLLFQYTFSNTDEIEKHRLAFFPSNTLPTVDEAPLLYEQDELFADIMEDRIVRFPIRFDFDPSNHKEMHPKSHLTLGQFENCRIPVSGPVMPYSFVLFILRNFYHRFYIKNQNIINKRMASCPAIPTLTELERKTPYFSVP